MIENENQNIGWKVINGSGWNHHKTADALNELIATTPDEIPTVPPGYGVLVAPISDKPFGMRCALVKLLPRITDEEGNDDGCDGEADAWAADNFQMDVKRVTSFKCEQQSDDDSSYFLKKMREAIASLWKPERTMT